MKDTNLIMKKYEVAVEHISFGGRWKLCIEHYLRRWGTI